MYYQLTKNENIYNKINNENNQKFESEQIYRENDLDSLSPDT